MSRKEGKAPRVDIYARITDHIVAELERGRPSLDAAVAFR